MNQQGGYTKPLPVQREIDKPFWRGAAAGELLLQHCMSCGRWWFPPSEFCPGCLGHNFSWDQASGLGEIWTRIVMHQVYFPSFAGDVPYNVVWVKLDEGPLITSSIVDADPSEIEVGARVIVTFDPVTDDISLPRFRLIP